MTSLRSFSRAAVRAFYFSVEKEGEVGAGDSIQFASRDPNKLSVSEVTMLYLLAARADPDALRKALRVEGLPESWKSHFKTPVARVAGRKPVKQGLNVQPKGKYSLVLIALTYLSFVSLGLPDGLNGVAWPSIRGYFHLPVDALGSLLITFTAGYLVSSFSSGRILSHIGVGSLLSISCLATAASLFGYTLAPAWWVMVTLGALSGLGAGAIDAGLNTFAASQFQCPDGELASCILRSRSRDGSGHHDKCARGGASMAKRLRDCGGMATALSNLFRDDVATVAEALRPYLFRFQAPDVKRKHT
jgi:hypothetical protein